MIQWLVVAAVLAPGQATTFSRPRPMPVWIEKESVIILAEPVGERTTYEKANYIPIPRGSMGQPRKPVLTRDDLRIIESNDPELDGVIAAFRESVDLPGLNDRPKSRKFLVLLEKRKTRLPLEFASPTAEEGYRVAEIVPSEISKLAPGKSPAEVGSNRSCLAWTPRM